MPHVITELCERCGSCAEVCPTECIVAGYPEDEWPTYYIDPNECIDCATCVTECEQNAIFADDEVPEEYADAIAKNAAFFSEGPGYDAAP